MKVAPWMQAVEAQLMACEILTFLSKVDKSALRKQWAVDLNVCKVAQPFDWGDETTRAVLIASRGIPDDTEINYWNLQAGASWWYFTEPLPFKTVNEDLPVRALSFSWTGTGVNRKIFPAGTQWAEIDEALVHGLWDKKLVVSAWVDEPPGLGKFRLGPSQIWTWNHGETIAQMKERLRKDHDIAYGPTGMYKNVGDGILDPEMFVQSSVDLTRFMLAGFAWLRQRVVIEVDGHIERHRRKELHRKTGNTATAVKVIQLRRAERPKSEGTDSDEEQTGEKREWSCRWMVGLETNGFWRNQPYGPGRKERRLIHIAPFQKGPKDKPLKVAPKSVFVVNR